MKESADWTKFRKRPDIVSLAIVVSHIGFVLAPLYLAALGPPPYYLPLLWLWLGLSMNGLLNLIHECAHYNVFSARWGSNLLGRWVLGPLLFTDFDAYRTRHWGHHRNLGHPDDPKYAYLVDITRWRMLHLVVRCLFLIEAIKKFLHQTADSSPAASETKSRLWLGRTLLMQAMLFGSLLATSMLSRHSGISNVLVSALVAYCGVYLYGVMSLTVFAATLRAIAEHQHGEDHAIEEGHAVLRNFRCDPLSRLLFGAYGFSEHATHHQEPGIPSYNLGTETARLAIANPGLAPARGYIGTLLSLIRPRNEERSKEPSFSSSA